MPLRSSLRRALGRLRPSAARPRVAAPVGRRISYSPLARNRLADPGEVVWTSVAFEDRPEESKDRPVLVVGRKDRRTVLALMLSSQTSRAGQDGWLALGRGAWDADGRPSFVRLDRVLEVGADRIRREGAVLDRARFDEVSSALRARHGWR